MNTPEYPPAPQEWSDEHSQKLQQTTVIFVDEYNIDLEQAKENFFNEFIKTIF